MAGPPNTENIRKIRVFIILILFLGISITCKITLLELKKQNNKTIMKKIINV